MAEMTPAQAEKNLQSAMTALAYDDAAQNNARFNHWKLGDVLSFNERHQLEALRDECLRVLGAAHHG